jgi:hypothetical protein
MKRNIASSLLVPFVSIAFLAMAISFPGVTSAVQLTDAQKCQFGKLKATGNFGSCLLKALAKDAKRPDGKLDDRLNKCIEKIDRIFTRLETKAEKRGGVCTTVNDAGVISNALVDCYGVVSGPLVNTLSTDDERKCAAGKLGATAKALQCRFKGEGNFFKKPLNGKRYVKSVGRCSDGVGKKFLRFESRFSCGSEDDHVLTNDVVRQCTHDVLAQHFPANFVNNGDGTSTDLRTGLMWELKEASDSERDYNDPHDVDNEYSPHGYCSVGGGIPCMPNAELSEACKAGLDGPTNRCELCESDEGVCEVSPTWPIVWQWLVDLNSSEFAGYNDWRIPTVEELASLIDLQEDPGFAVNSVFNGSGCNSGCVDTTDPDCSCSAIEYASVTVDRSARDNHIHSKVVHFDGDPTHLFYTIDFGFVRAVRGHLD